MVLIDIVDQVAKLLILTVIGLIFMTILLYVSGDTSASNIISTAFFSFITIFMPVMVAVLLKIVMFTSRANRNKKFSKK